MARFEPIPDPAGHLLPPSRRPPTAVGLLTPPAPERLPSRRPPTRGLVGELRRLIEVTLDATDTLVATVRRRLRRTG